MWPAALLKAETRGWPAAPLPPAAVAALPPLLPPAHLLLLLRSPCRYCAAIGLLRQLAGPVPLAAGTRGVVGRAASWSAQGLLPLPA